MDQEVLRRIRDLKDRSIAELRSYSNPGKKTVQVLKAVAILFKVDTADWDWIKAKLMIKDSRAFKQKMIEFEVDSVSDRTVNLLQRFESSDLNAPGSTRNISEAVHAMWCWVAAVATKCGLEITA